MWPGDKLSSDATEVAADGVPGGKLWTHSGGLLLRGNDGKFVRQFDKYPFDYARTSLDSFQVNVGQLRIGDKTVAANKFGSLDEEKIDLELSADEKKIETTIKVGN